MSAWIVSKSHIDALVNAAARYGMVDTAADARRVGAMLWRENHTSVNYRYDDHTPTPRYAFLGDEREFHPAAVLKALDSYEYQTYEHPTWTTSEARAWCARLHTALTDALPADQRRTVGGRLGRIPAYEYSCPYQDTAWCIETLDDLVLAAQCQPSNSPSSTPDR